MINLQNEIINYLSTNCRADFVHKKGTVTKATIVFTDPPKPITAATVGILYQTNGELLLATAVNIEAADKISFDLPDFTDYKALNYAIIAKDQDGDCLFYGAFTLI